VSSAGRQVIVVGGGVIGAACAHYLAKANWTVTLLDRGEFGRGCSHGNCGFVCPSHVLPLAAPGALGMALRSLLRRDAPFRIKPRFDPALWAWLYCFARRCNVPDMMEAGRAIQALLNSSRRLYDQLLEEEALDCEWEVRGLLFVLQNAQAMEHYAEMEKLLRDSFGLSARRYDGDELIRLEPALKPGLAGGWLYDKDAHLRPDKLMASWRRNLEARGVTVRLQCEMKGFAREHDRARAVVTSQGELAADAFVVATGAWTPLLAKYLGCRVPIQPGKGYSITMPRPARCPNLPLILEEHRVAVTPLQSGYRLGSTMEFAGYNTSLDPRRLDLLRRAASHYLHEPYGDVVEEEWFGWRPMTYDGKPIIDRSPAMANVWIAAGHNMLGLSMAPATGKLLAELLDNRPPHVDPQPYALSRF
jgi:D-amino-acid dehydrogenase